MIKTSLLGLAVCCVASALVVGCGDDAPAQPAVGTGGGGTAGGGAGGGSAGTPGGAGGGNVGTTAGVPLSWTTTGWIDRMASGNTVGVQGPWYAYDDCMDAAAAGLTGCTMWDSTLMGGEPAKAGVAFTETSACAKGQVTVVENMMFGAQWGAGIALDLNSAGGLNPPKTPFDATANGVTGFAIDVKGAAPTTIRMNVTTVAAGTDSHFVEVPVTAAGTEVVVRWTDPKLKQGSWVMAKTPFDPTQILALQLQVFTDASAPKPFDFCASNLRALTD
jgi:hypothetical protein